MVVEHVDFQGVVKAGLNTERRLTVLVLVVVIPCRLFTFCSRVLMDGMDLRSNPNTESNGKTNKANTSSTTATYLPRHGLSMK